MTWCFFVPLALNVYLNQLLSLILGVFLGLVIEFLSRYIWLRLRYKQQEFIFFHEIARASNEVMNSGERTPEVELRNRITWEHQQALRLADERGEFIKVLEARFRDAKSFVPETVDGVGS